MLFAIALLATTDGKLRAIAPDLAHCDLTGSTEQELLPKLRLAIEGELTRLLLAGEELPDSRHGEPVPGFSPTGTVLGPVRWLNVHINVGHLEALARHQAGR
jgi:predicted RNase H-like HicB family nuclease